MHIGSRHLVSATDQEGSHHATFEAEDDIHSDGDLLRQARRRLWKWKFVEYVEYVNDCGEWSDPEPTLRRQLLGNPGARRHSHHAGYR